MFRIGSRFFQILSIVSLLILLSTSSVLSAEVSNKPGTSPEMAMMPMAGSVTIEPGEWHWYLFRSQVPVNVKEDKGFVVTRAQDATIEAKLNSETDEVGFEVWSADDLRDFYEAKKFEPMGIGTLNETFEDDPLFWQGSFSHNENFYLIVMNRSDKAATYTLNMSGHVAFPSTYALNKK